MAARLRGKLQFSGNIANNLSYSPTHNWTWYWHLGFDYKLWWLWKATRINSSWWVYFCDCFPVVLYDSTVGYVQLLFGLWILEHDSRCSWFCLVFKLGTEYWSTFVLAMLLFYYFLQSMDILWKSLSRRWYPPSLSGGLFNTSIL